MTCIVGITQNNTVTIGGDSAVTSDYHLGIRKDGKIFPVGPYLFGVAGSMRVLQLLRYAFTPPKHYARDDDDRHMVTTFINTVRSCLKDGGATKIEHGEESIPGVFLVGYNGRLWQVESDFQIGESVVPFAAVGCGDRYALGALHALGLPFTDPKAAIITALAAAEYFNAGVRGPFILNEQRHTPSTP